MQGCQSAPETMWDQSTFSANRERLFAEDLARLFFAHSKRTAEWAKVGLDEHFIVDGTLIEARASPTSHMAHGPTDNRSGLVVDVEVTHATGTAQRQAALAKLARSDNPNKLITLGAEKRFDCRSFLHQSRPDCQQTFLPQFGDCFFNGR